MMNHKICFNVEKWIIILKISSYPFLSGAVGSGPALIAQTSLSWGYQSEVQIRPGNWNNFGIIFLFAHENVHCNSS